MELEDLQLAVNGRIGISIVGLIVIGNVSASDNDKIISKPEGSGIQKNQGEQGMKLSRQICFTLGIDNHADFRVDNFCLRFFSVFIIVQAVQAVQLIELIDRLIAGRPGQAR